MDDPFLLLLLRFGFGRERRFEGQYRPHIRRIGNSSCSAWHLGVAERAHLHHGHSFPQAGPCRHPALLAPSIMEHICAALALPAAMYPASLLLSPQTLVAAHAEPVPAPDTLTPTFALMREALHQALQLRFTAALEVAMPGAALATPSGSAVNAGIIAYFQARWQIPLPSTTRQAGLARHAP